MEGYCGHGAYRMQTPNTEVDKKRCIQTGTKLQFAQLIFWGNFDFTPLSFKFCMHNYHLELSYFVNIL